MYEMLTGNSPFRGKGRDRQATYDKILCGVVKFPKEVDPVCKNFVKKLLVRQEVRLGSKVGRLLNIKNLAKISLHFAKICLNFAKINI